jgi:hypothetical protein
MEKHNHAKNPLDREDRQQWPAVSVLRAYKEGQLDLFRKFQENYTGDATEDPKWQKRWGDFVAKLAEADRSDEEKIQTIQKFMTSQRTRVYRQSNIKVSTDVVLVSINEIQYKDNNVV